MNKLYFLCYVLSAALLAGSARAQLTLTPVITGLNFPMELVSPPDATGRMFVAERSGRIRIISGNTVLPGNFLDFSALVSTQGERGFLSMAFHPNYAANRYFFVLYNNAAGSLVLSRYRADSLDPNLADPASGTVLMTIPHPTFDNHNGGKLAFGTDGKLFWSTGDGGGGNDPFGNAQNGHSLLGKMLRLNVDSFNTAPYFSIPADNPFISDTAVAGEIWNLGLRNPYRWSFDRLNGDMWIGDVGQGGYEEVDHMPLAASGGVNYGWVCREGAHPHIGTGCAPSGYTDPVFEYDRSVGVCITGGYVYRGATSPSLYGKYICIDFISGNAFIVTPGVSAPYASVMQAALKNNITAFGEDATGELFAAAVNGTIYAVTGPPAPLPVDMISFGYSRSAGHYQLQWQAMEKEISHYEIERSEDGRSYSAIGRQRAANRKELNNYTFSLASITVPEAYYRLGMISLTGEKRYSKVLPIPKHPAGNGITVYPTIATNLLTIQSDAAWQEMICTDITGKIALQLKQDAGAGYQAVDVSRLTPGTYFMRILARDGNFSNHRFIISR